jgi:hypothetical protein
MTAPRAQAKRKVQHPITDFLTANHAKTRESDPTVQSNHGLHRWARIPIRSAPILLPQMAQMVADYEGSNPRLSV